MLKIKFLIVTFIFLTNLNIRILNSFYKSNEKHNLIQQYNLIYSNKKDLFSSRKENCFYSLLCNNLKIRRFILRKIFNKTRKKVYKVKYIYLNSFGRTGNNIRQLSNAIFFCEILNCTNIITSNNFWFIKKKVKIISHGIILYLNKSNFNSINNNSIVVRSLFFFGFEEIINQDRTIYLRNIFDELVINKINTSYDLYMYIRSGDIFIDNIHPNYAQPPFCFYESILDNWFFNNIFIISSGKENPVLEYLLNEFPYIKYKTKTKLLDDFIKLIEASNLVLGRSSFTYFLINLSNNIKNNWKFIKNEPIEPLAKFKIKIFKMNATKNYNVKMAKWENNVEQRKLMINENCEKWFYQNF